MNTLKKIFINLNNNDKVESMSLSENKFLFVTYSRIPDTHSCCMQINESPLLRAYHNGGVLLINKKIGFDDINKNNELMNLIMKKTYTIRLLFGSKTYKRNDNFFIYFYEDAEPIGKILNRLEQEK